MAEDNENKSFKDLGVNEQLVEACGSLGWKRPSEIQIKSIPLALDGKDIIALAQTGSGKTGAFVIPILQSHLEAQAQDSQAFYACVLSPTPLLAIEIAKQFNWLGSGIGIRCALLVEGFRMKERIALALEKRPHIVVATPGCLVDHLSNTKGFSLSTLKYFVLDEADKFVNEDFEKSLNEILNVIPSERITFLFSATMTNKVENLQRAACLRNPVKIEAASKYSNPEAREVKIMVKKI